MTTFEDNLTSKHHLNNVNLTSHTYLSCLQVVIVWYLQLRINIFQIPLECLALEVLPEFRTFADVVVFLLLQIESVKKKINTSFLILRKTRIFNYGTIMFNYDLFSLIPWRISLKRVCILLITL